VMIAQLRLASVTVRVKARISENGDVEANDLQGGNPLLYGPIREAVQQWKFSPIVMQGQTRCVETEIPIVINFSK
jgi:hypothetical protein